MTKEIKQFDVPILFIIFRRKDTALKVIKAIAKVKPKKLYISQDGPRNRDEEKEILETRETVLSKVNWNCQLTLWTHKKNLGLKKHIPEALNKFFKNEKMGIYLEDDTLPSKEFFYFEQELLEKYKDDKRIFSINGTNFYPEIIKSKDSYYLSKIGSVWGFGLWRRSWKLYKSNMTGFKKELKLKEYNNYFFSRKHRFYLEAFWKTIKRGGLDSWAMQLIYAAITNNTYFITPSVNMVNIINKGESVTNISIQEYYKSYESPFPIKFPKNLSYNKKYDMAYFGKMLKGGWVRLWLINLYLHMPSEFKKLII